MLRRDADRVVSEFLLAARGLRGATAVLAERIAFGYLDWARERPTVRLTAASMAEFMLGWFPRYGLIAGPDVPRVPTVLASLVRFLADRGRLAPGERDRILATVEANRPAFLRAARDPRRFSAAKLASLGAGAIRRMRASEPGRASERRLIAGDP